MDLMKFGSLYELWNGWQNTIVFYPKQELINYLTSDGRMRCWHDAPQNTISLFLGEETIKTKGGACVICIFLWENEIVAVIKDDYKMKRIKIT